MGKVDRVRNRVEPFAALFWTLGIDLPTPDPARRPAASLHCRTQSMSLNGPIGSILYEDAKTPFPRNGIHLVLYLTRSVSLGPECRW